MRDGGFGGDGKKSLAPLQPFPWPFLCLRGTDTECASVRTRTHIHRRTHAHRNAWRVVEGPGDQG